ncbi:helicase-related protein [Avibacterium paragallinarum]|uniref:SNF2-related protein n=1 Tax=Avibacterium paragallinarum TaxID=728 RepID=A0ABU7QP49_AVIPA|nr:helicase-related protein [Avibacterium paragallinarum]
MKLLDNINHLFGDDLKVLLTPQSRLKIAAACFSIYAFDALKKSLKNIDSLEFIFTAPTFSNSHIVDDLTQETREFYISKLKRERALYGSEFEIQLRNQLTQKAIAKECAAWIEKKATFKSSRTHAPMQQFACIDAAENSTTYVPLQGFTASDLGYQKNAAISNYINRIDAPAAQHYLELFDQIWQDAELLEDVTAQVTDHIASVYKENSPESVYFLMLYHIFGAFLQDVNEDVLANERTGYQESVIWNMLFPFQKDAAAGIINKLETFSGCILADSVGLGKTFTALAVIKYYELRNRSVLVLCPKKLADNWLTYNRNLTTNVLIKDRLNYDVLCHTDLSREGGESFGMDLSRVNWGNYDLVVIDESHNFRNNDAYRDKETRYQKLMNKIIKAGVKTKVLMLSATPVNNRFTDLRNQLALAYEGNSETLRKQLRFSKSIESLFSQAQAAFNQWSRLPLEARTPQAILNRLNLDFFELLDSVTIARSRKHIEAFYGMGGIGHFPKRLPPIAHRLPLTDLASVPSFQAISQTLATLKLAVYAPMSYVLPSQLGKYQQRYDTHTKGKGTLSQTDREKSLQALMTTNLLKRLESSVEAFRRTLEALKQSNAEALDKIYVYEARTINTSTDDHTAILAALEGEEDELPNLDDAQSIGKKIKIDLADMNLPEWRRGLESDQHTIQILLDDMAKITPAHDAKLQHLKAQIQHKIENPINGYNRKILIFTAFADTADYLYQNLAPEMLEQLSIHSAKITGNDRQSNLKAIGKSKRSYDFQELLTLFSPRSKNKAAALPEEAREIDLLIGTDCISEGQNLQDCDTLINYDIHWNPVRIIQRFGRIDRIGSQNQCIQLINYWPDLNLDEYINLKERVENRMMIADMAATGDDNLLNNQASDLDYRKDQLSRLQNGEIIELEDSKTGLSITDLGLNDFRMDLLSQLKANAQVLENMPTGIHAVLPAEPENGLPAGVIFLLRNEGGSADLKAQNPLYPYYLIYMDKQGTRIHDHSQIKTLLDLLRRHCKGKDQPIADVCAIFNQQTKDGKDMKAYAQSLNQAIAAILEHKEEKDLDSLFKSGGTTALASSRLEQGEFELIAFFAIEECS